MAIARILRDMGLRQGNGKDFTVRGFERNGERFGTMVVPLTRAANDLIDARADEIESASEEAGFPFLVSTEYGADGRAWPNLVNFGERVRSPRPAIATRESDVKRNVLQYARKAGFVVTHHGGAVPGVAQLNHDNGNVLIVSFSEGAFVSAEGSGWGDAPWTSESWATNDPDEYRSILAGR